MRSSIGEGQLTQKARSDTPLCTSVQLFCKIRLLKSAMIFAIQPGASAKPLQHCPTLPGSQPARHCANRLTSAISNSFTFILFQTPCAREENSTLFFSMPSALFCKNTRVGVQSRREFQCPLSIHPQKPTRNSFPCNRSKTASVQVFSNEQIQKRGEGGRP